ncbi:MAG: peptide deformylase [Bacteroidales bacterium]|jgi:peptide deformylase|nr:peptide deformylase [Bacteroidales bacterium]
MLLPVYVYGHPILRRQAVEIDPKSGELPQFIADLFETMYHDNGVGLAAPQVGKSIRVFVIDTAPFTETEPDFQPVKLALINPVILEEYGDDSIFNEGCLSIPDVHADVTRKSTIKVRYCNENGETVEQIFDGLTARVFQHEYDHLEGKTFIDRLPQVKKMFLKRKLTDIATGKTTPFYKTIKGIK